MNINYKPLIIKLLGDIGRETDLTFGEIIYEILRKKHVPSKPDDVKTFWITGVKDSNFYAAIEAILKDEVDEE